MNSSHHFHPKKWFRKLLRHPKKGAAKAAGLGANRDLAGMNGLKIQNQFYWEHMDTYGTFDIDHRRNKNSIS
jgi:hypothetical protein